MDATQNWVKILPWQNNFVASKNLPHDLGYPPLHHLVSEIYKRNNRWATTTFWYDQKQNHLSKSQSRYT